MSKYHAARSRRLTRPPLAQPDKMDSLRERAEEIADFAVGARHNADMYQRVADMALTELRAAVEAERALLHAIRTRYGVYCKLTGEKIADVQFAENSGSCRCLSKDRCELRNNRRRTDNG